MHELERLYKEIQPNIYAFFYVKTSDRSVAEDLTQDVFYDACKSIHTFKGHSTLKTWLFSLAKNKLKKYYRTKQYHIQLQEKLKSDYREIYQTTEDIIISQENARIIYHYIQQLDGIKKEIAILRIYGELSFKEIATLIQKNESYVRVVFYRIKLQMVKEMGEEQ